MTMQLTNERKSDSLEYDMDLSKSEATMLREYGLKKIQEDDEALINYAVNHILFEMTQNLEYNIEKLKKIVENKRKIKKNSKKA